MQVQYIGYYELEEDAARAYDRAILQLRGPSMQTNFPISNYEGRGAADAQVGPPAPLLAFGPAFLLAFGPAPLLVCGPASLLAFGPAFLLVCDPASLSLFAALPLS